MLIQFVYITMVCYVKAHMNGDYRAFGVQNTKHEEYFMGDVVGKPINLAIKPSESIQALKKQIGNAFKFDKETVSLMSLHYMNKDGNFQIIKERNAETTKPNTVGDIPNYVKLLLIQHEGRKRSLETRVNNNIKGGGKRRKIFL